MHPTARRTVASLLALLFLAGFSGCNNRTSDANLVFVSAVEGSQLVEGQRRLLNLGGRGGAWVDARSKTDFEAGHIPGAVSMPLQRVSQDHTQLRDHRVLVVYGRNFNDPLATGLSKRLIELGHKDVRTLRGGVRAWTDAGLELETDDES
jgi:3-mercaptopyruvate sulfurtransferase SseA